MKYYEDDYLAVFSNLRSLLP